jgi:hypothetical protein
MAAALWGLDFMFTLAQFGAAGVNMETGVNHLGFLSWYTPIGLDSDKAYRATPLYYGMLAFALASRGDRIQLDLENAGLNLTGYAVRSDHGDIWLTLINKEATRDAHVRAACPGIRSAQVTRLTAPSLTSKDGVRLSQSIETVHAAGGETEIAVPAASAALLHFR